MKRLRAAVLLATVVLVTGACTYFPTVLDTGGVRIQPRNGRAVRQANGAEFYVEVASTGKFGDALIRAESEVAQRAQLVGPSGAPLARLEIDGETVVRLAPGSHRVVLADLKRPLKAGEVVIVTLYFEKSGGIGVITVVE